MANELTKSVVETPDQQAEKVTIAAVMAAIKCGFDPADTRTVNVKQVIDACAIIVTFLKEMENGPSRTVTEWRIAVENLSVTLGSTP